MSNVTQTLNAIEQGDANAPDKLPPPTPAPPELVERASRLVREHPECLWFRHPDARVRHVENVRLTIEHLREYGSGEQETVAVGSAISSGRAKPLPPTGGTPNVWSPAFRRS